MLSQRQRPILLAAAALVMIWVVALAGYEIAKNAKVTPEKVRAYVVSVDFSQLSAAERAEAIRKLAAMLNALTLEERQRLRLDRNAWFEKMTEDEKEKFLEATMPTGIKQMLAAFEALPPDRQQRTVNDAIRQMKSADRSPDPNGMALSPELQQKMMKVGLQSFYNQSSAQTKAELAPLLEQMQQMMESGRMMRGPRQP
ncbi:MAG TPA: hypothetical protein VIK53_02280 [Verrucomicrobiae bacterium]